MNYGGESAILLNGGSVLPSLAYSVALDRLGPGCQKARRTVLAVERDPWKELCHT